MKKLPKRNIPTFYPEVLFNEDTEERTFICPISGENVYNWGLNHQNYPDALLYISYVQADEPIYLKPALHPLLTSWEELDNTNDYVDFQDFLIRSLPREEAFFLIVLEDPENIVGETTYYLYRGVHP